MYRLLCKYKIKIYLIDKMFRPLTVKIRYTRKCGTRGEGHVETG